MGPGDPYGQRDQFADLRPKLARWLRDEGEAPEIESRIWNYLLDNPELMRRARQGEMARLAQQYGVLRKHFGGRSRGSHNEVEVGPDARSDALAQIAAYAALRYEWHIRGFRQTHLHGGLVPTGEIATWVEEQAAREGSPGASYLRMPIADDRQLELLIAGDRAQGYARLLAAEAERVAADLEAEVPESFFAAPHRLAYGVPGQRAKSIAIRGDGVLAELRSLTGEPFGLHGHVPWSEFEAVAFILSGWVPPLPKASVGIRFAHGYYASLSRLRLEVDPRLTPREVGQLYNRWRARFLQGRDRPMDEKHLALAVFTEQTRHDGASWSTLRESWNSEHPEWAFAVDEDPFAKRFALECRTAWSRVTGEKWGHCGGLREGPFTKQPRKNRPSSKETDQ